MKKGTAQFILLACASAVFTFLFSANLPTADCGEAFCQTSSDEVILGGGGTDDRTKWAIFDSFDGYQTKADPQKISEGANPIGQNTFINDGDRITARDFGYEIFPNEDARSTDSAFVGSLHTFRKRDGVNLMMKAIDDGSSVTLQYYNSDVGDWEVLKDSYTTGNTFGFADHNTNVDQTGYVYFGNSVEPYSRWTGNVSVITSDITSGDATINVDSTLLYPSSGTIVFCGEEHAYSSKATTTFSLTGTASTNCATGRGVTQAVEEFPAAPRGNILLVLNTRMFVAGVASTTQALYYSQIADASDFTFSAPRVATDGGIINMPEGGGGITALAVDEKVMYVFKRNIIKSVTFTQDGEDLPVIEPIKPYDGRSQTVGAINQRSVFAGGNGIFFITPNNEIMNIGRVPDVDYPQVVPISDVIKPTTDALDFRFSVGAFWKNKAYFAAKSAANTLDKNDVILVWNTERLAWESPVVGIPVNEFTIARYGVDEELYFGHNSEPNIYQINNSRVDDQYGFAANWRSREETFGVPHYLKSIDMFYVEGYIDENTTLNISLLLDENGVTQTFSTEVVGSEISDYIFFADAYNLFGFHPFGYERFGGNEDFTGQKKFRIYFARGVDRIPFHSLQIEFASDGQSQNWEILRYGFSVMVQPQPLNGKLYKAL